MQTEALRSLMLFETFSDEQLQWLTENSGEVVFKQNENIFVQDTEGDALWVLIEGGWRLVRLMDGSETTFVNTSQPGTWAGGIPLPKGMYQATAQATTPTRMLRIPDDAVEYMLDKGYPIANHLLAGITVGARNMAMQTQQHEKMLALGKLSAGLAHELNNPAAAAQRAAAQMRETLAEMQTALLKLAAQLSPAQLERVIELQGEAATKAKNPPTLDSLEQSEREDELSSWLDDHEVAEGWKVAATFVGAGLDSDWLDRLAQELAGETLDNALNWLAATLTASDLLNQLEQSNERISILVKSVKEYSYMDQAPVQEIDVHDGLESTLTMLAHKLRQGVTVTREYNRSLPRINAYGSELNQVWTNLLDNAVDAMHGQGQIWIRTRAENNCIVVEIADNGPGIPPQIQSRIFEPFFTTKGVGEGSGLGLDIAYRIVVQRHKGELKLVSQPGDTRFQVSLPLPTETVEDV